MFRFTVQKKEWDLIVLTAESAIVLFLGLQFGKTGAAYLSLAALTFFLFYSVFGSEIAREFGCFAMRRKLKEETVSLHTQESKMLFFTFLLSLAGGGVIFLAANPLSLILGRAELRMVFRLLSVILPISAMVALLKEILVTEYTMLLYRILSLVEILFFVGFYFLIKMKLESYGVLVQALVQTEMAYAYYGILAIFLAILTAKILFAGISVILFVKTKNRVINDEVTDYRKREVFHPTKIYVRGLPKLLLKFQVCCMAMVFTGRYLSKAEDTILAIANIGKQYGCIMVIIVAIPFVVELLTVYFQQKALTAVTREERKTARKSISTCIQYLWIFSIMPAFSILVLKEHIVSLLGQSFLGSESLLVKAAFLSIPVLIIVLCTGIWNELQPLIVLCITLVGNILFSLLLWFQMNNNTNKILLFTGCYLTAMAILFFMLTIREYGIHTEILSKMLFSSVFAAVLSLLMLGMKILLTPHLGVGITLLLCLAVGFFLYWILLFSFHILSDKDQRGLPLIRLLKRGKQEK